MENERRIDRFEFVNYQGTRPALSKLTDVLESARQAVNKGLDLMDHLNWAKPRLSGMEDALKSAPTPKWVRQECVKAERHKLWWIAVLNIKPICTNICQQIASLRSNCAKVRDLIRRETGCTPEEIEIADANMVAADIMIARALRLAMELMFKVPWSGENWYRRLLSVLGQRAAAQIETIPQDFPTYDGALRLLAACLNAVQICGGKRDGLAVSLLDGGVYVMNQFNKWSLLNGTSRLDKALAKGKAFGPYIYDEGVVNEVIELLRGSGWKAEYIEVEVLRKLSRTRKEVRDDVQRRRDGKPLEIRKINLLSFVPPRWPEIIVDERRRVV